MVSCRLAVKRFDRDSLKNVNLTFKNSASTWLEINTEFQLTERYYEPKSQDCFTDNLKVRFFTHQVQNYVKNKTAGLSFEKRRGSRRSRKFSKFVFVECATKNYHRF